MWAAKRNKLARNNPIKVTIFNSLETKTKIKLVPLKIADRRPFLISVTS